MSDDVVTVWATRSANRLSEVLGLHRDHLGPSWMEVRRKGGKVHRVALPDDLRRVLLERCHAKSGYVFPLRWEPEKWLEAIMLHPAADHTFRYSVEAVVDAFAPNLKGRIRRSGMAARPSIA